MRRYALLLLLAAAPAWACTGLKVTEAWVREAPPGAPMLAGYAKLANPTKKSMTVFLVDSPDFGEVAMHQTMVMDGMSHMHGVEELEIPAKKSKRFAPGGLHLMLMQPKKPLKAGDKVTINFHCGPEAPVSVVFPVKSGA